MNTTCFKIIHLLALLLYLLSGGCSRGQKVKAYKIINTKKILNSEAVRSRDLIDNYRTFQIFFRLEKEVDSIRIGISSSFLADNFIKKRKTSRNYFIVEKHIDLTRFNKRNYRYTFSEIGKNFDIRWNREREITIISSKVDPIKTLDNRSIYRIRFSTFSLEKFDFIIKINADCEVIFMNDF